MRRQSRITVGTFLVLPVLFAIVLAPTAEAQAKPIIQVNVAASPSEFTIRKSHGQADYVFTITFTCLSGQDSYGPCNGQVGDQNVQVTPTITATQPTGWKYAADTTSFQMKAKDTRTIPLTVQLLDDEPEKPGFSVSMEVRAQPITNPTLDPVLGTTFAQASTDTDLVKVEKILNLGEAFSSVARRFMWPLLFAAAVLLVTGVVLVERKRGSLEVACDGPSQSIVAGRGASFPVTLRNASSTDDRLHVSLTELPPGWAAIVPLNEIELRAGERTQMWVTVRAPADASPGEAVSFKLRARSLRGQRSGDVDLSATVVGNGRHEPTQDAFAPPAAPPIDFEAEAPATSMPQRPGARPRPRRK